MITSAAGRTHQARKTGSSSTLTIALVTNKAQATLVKICERAKAAKDEPRLFLIPDILLYFNFIRALGLRKT